MKQLRWVWILGIAAVLLIGIFIVVDMKSDKKEAEKHIGEAKQLFQFDGAEATKLTIQNEEGVFSFRWNDVKYTWEQAEGDPFHVNSYVIAAMVNYASNLKSLKISSTRSSDRCMICSSTVWQRLRIISTVTCSPKRRYGCGV